MASKVTAPPAMVIERQLLTVEEYTVLLNKSVSTVVDWMERGVIPGEKVGNTWVIRIPEVQDYLHGRWEPKRRPRMAVVRKIKEHAA